MKFVFITCTGFISPLTGERRFGDGHTQMRRVRTQDAHQVTRCVQCQRAYEWYRWQANMKAKGKPYQEEYDGPVIIKED